MAEWKQIVDVVPGEEGIYKVRGFEVTDQGKHKYETKAELKIIGDKLHWYDLGDEQSDVQMPLNNVTAYKRIKPE